VAGALSGTDWNTFNGKLNLTSPITGYTVGANTALAATDTLLGAFGKIQGQINNRLQSNAFSTGRVGYAGSTNVLEFSSGFTWNNITGSLAVSVQYDIITGRDSYVTSGNNASIYRSSVNAIPSYPFATAGALILQSRISTNNDIVFVTGSPSVWRWSVKALNGNLESNGSQSIVSTNNGNISIIPNGTGLVGITTTSPTNTLDVNGTTRIRTISNLGSTATRFLVASATGVVSERTGAELAADIGATNFWTIDGTGIIRNSLVAIGRTTVQANNQLTIRQQTNDDTAISLRCERLDGTVRFEVRNSYSQFFNEVAIDGATAGNQALRVRQRTSDDTVASLICQNSGGTTRFEVRNSFSQFSHQVAIVGISTDTQALRVRNGNTNALFVGQNNSGSNIVVINNNGDLIPYGRIVANGSAFGTSFRPDATLQSRGEGTTTGVTLLLEDSAGTDNVQFIDNGQIRFLRLPTSSAGLPAGSLWNNGGVINIV
jgi:hypothetical protein